MAPTPAPAPVEYGVIKDPEVRAFIGGLTSSMRDQINNAIDSLQSDPRPTGHEARVFNGMPVIKWVVQTTRPPYILVYSVDDRAEKVYVMAVQEKRFS